VPAHLVIFDCDGVLVDSERVAVDIDVRALAALGWTITREEVIRRFLGRSEPDVMREIVDHLGRPLPPGWEEHWAAEYRRAFDEELEAVPGVHATVSSIVAQGYAVCVGSSGGHEKIRRNLSRTGLRGFFAEDIFSASDVRRGKPAPDLFLHAVRTMGCDRADCVVVEDSQYGVAAARAAGMRVIGFAGGVTPRTQLAVAHLGSVHEIRPHHPARDAVDRSCPEVAGGGGARFRPRLDLRPSRLGRPARLAVVRDHADPDGCGDGDVDDPARHLRHLAELPPSRHPDA